MSIDFSLAQNKFLQALYFLASRRRQISWHLFHTIRSWSFALFQTS